MTHLVDVHDSRLGRIKIIATPFGDAPREIKEKWIGVEIPCLWYDPSCFLKGLVDKNPREAREGYVVLQTHAIEVLSMVSQPAVDWWESIGYPENERATFVFNVECVKVLKRPPTKGVLTGENN
jgi:hypothetical protein